MTKEQDTSKLVEIFQKVSDELLGNACDQRHACRLPSVYAIRDLCQRFVQLLFPRSHFERVDQESSLRVSVPRSLSKVYQLLTTELEAALEYAEIEGGERRAREISLALVEELPSIKEVLECDLSEVLKHDPAATGREEVLLSYPGVQALTVHRVANFLYRLEVPLIPRMMSEIVHSSTGIDIHPGATIAPYCSIDHGTGLIIGETTVIGEHVNLFHNVTLGAKSVTPEFKGAKRHPTIGHHVIIYPGATVLGDIVVGDNTVIGGNAFLLESCPPNSKVYAKPPEMIFRSMES